MKCQILFYGKHKKTLINLPSAASSHSMVLRGPVTLSKFSAVFTRETTFVTSCLFSYIPRSFERRGLL